MADRKEISLEVSLDLSLVQTWIWVWLYLLFVGVPEIWQLKIPINARP